MMEKAILTAAELMALSARTAPKTAGQDLIEIEIIQGEDLLKISREMEAYGKKSTRPNWDRDARGVEASGAVLLIAVREKTAGLNCGACGYSQCSDLPSPKEGLEFEGPLCAWRLVDLGIAVGSAAKTAGILNVDNRIMYRLGVIAKKMGLIGGEVVLGIPLAAHGKNIFFDRK
jgi:uncharacterized ferredoxin-like protein